MLQGMMRHVPPQGARYGERRSRARNPMGGAFLRLRHALAHVRM